ncbi:MAG: tRNA uridine-5-carboxymethylaminomethyl(34) synthesis GTPase MnmE [Opitutaceae bacterium]|nr:tRNA uridine-5-carboxymethylaminomethyl(34) synthesis GTPase MnmE [Opitutaceae bacterium]
MAEVETIVAPATPRGESALALVRVSGPRAASIAAAQSRGAEPQPRRAWHGDYRDVTGNAVDDVVFTFFGGPRSYTGEDVLEISCHGNPFIVRKVLDDLLARGCRMAEAGEFTRRAFLNGRLDLTAAEAVMDVIRARSDRALEAARLQLRGALGRRIDRLVGDLLQCCATVEAYIDFPEEDLPVEDRMRRRADLAALLAEIGGLRATRRHGDLLREGLRVVLLGAPNAGKSSLLNRLAGYDRAIVSEEPGTTRDFLEEPVLLGPHRIRVFDTAGLREAGGAVERAGVERSLERAEEADLVVLVVDATAPCPTLPQLVRDRLATHAAVLAVNKCDLPERHFEWPFTATLARVEVSAQTGAGLDELRRVLIERADRITGTGSDEEHVAVNARHAVALAEAEECLRRADRLLAEEHPLELVGSEMRLAVGALGAIVGRIDHEAILDRLFASFCIGK